MTTAVVLVHGIWMNGLEMSLLRYRIHCAGFKTFRFSYPSVRRNLSQNAQSLQTFIHALDYDRIDIVAHSLGGLVVRQLFVDFPRQPPGRVVTIGTPHQGSILAKRMDRSTLGRLLLGASLEEGLLGGLPPWPCTHDIGIIAGNVGIGMGTLITRLPKPNDGTVTIEESELPDMSDYVSLPVSHMSMVFSPLVAKKVIHFLHYGRFENIT